MPKWITKQLGTASYYDIGADIFSSDIVVVDVRGLVDKEGNSDRIITEMVCLVTDAIARGRQVLVCCDKGLSRSNAIALAALLSMGMPYDDAMRLFFAQGLKDMNMALLHQIKRLYLHPSTEKQNNAGGVLVTGGSGFIGRHLVERLEKSSFLVYSADREQLSLATNPPVLDSYINEHHIKAIVHLAHPRYRSNIDSMGEAIQMTKNILEACRLNDSRLYFISGLTVFSGHISEEPLVANSIKPLPKGTYGETKYLCEELVANYRIVHKIRAAILRPSAVYGPGQDRAVFMEKFLLFAASGKDIVTHEYINGRPTFDFLYVDDLADAIEKALANQFVGTIHIGTGVARTTFQVAELICEATKSLSKISTQQIDDRTSKIIVDPAEAQARLGWRPLVSLKDGIERVVNAKLL